MIKDYFQMPVDSTWISVGYNSSHTALDMGWTKEVGMHQPIYPIAEGVVVDKGWYKDGGNHVWTRHETPDNTWYAGYMHMKDPSPLSVGTKVTRKTRIGNMGSTGRSTGPHVHFVLVKAPKNTKWSNSGTRKYRVNPAKYLYRFPHQVVKSGDAKISAKPKTPYGEAQSSKEVKEDGKITVTASEGLRVRKSPSLESEQIDLLKKGDEKVYTHYVDAEGFRWVRLKQGGYSARRTLDSKEVYAKAEFLKSSSSSKPTSSKPAPKPKPKPKPKPQTKSDVGKKWTPNKVPLTLYPKSSGGTSYSPSRTKRTYTILAEKNGRIQIKNRYFQSPGNKVWVRKSDGKVSGGSTSKPASNVGKYANMKGNIRLFKVARKDDTYPNGKNKKTNLRARSAEILKEDSGRVLVSVPSFNPSKVWVAKSEISISRKPKYSVN